MRSRADSIKPQRVVGSWASGSNDILLGYELGRAGISGGPKCWSVLSRYRAKASADGEERKR